jgi:para-aminobenzoate synthetase component 1
MDMGDFQIISNSPERLLKTEGTSAETSPIKGTRPRGRTPEEDKRFIWALKNSAKERAEHVMIVDLERSDLGAVSAPGSVNVTEFEAVKTFPGLHHMVSTISSTLESSSLECLRAIFPGGSVTGAPKIRAMEIIDELENAPRGLYTGGLGWVDFSGDMDMTMAIRTAVYKDGALYLSVGSGIVADSKPEEEYDETILKAKDFFDAIIKK